jgi:DNA-binding LacI/PurR family transcriptional regulator
MSLLAPMNHSKFTPKYVELARDLIRDIAGRGLRRGDLLTTESELIKRYNLSRGTARQALELLEGEGFVTRQKARGTFVEREIDSAAQFGLLRGTVLLVCSNEQNAHRSEDNAFSTVLCAMEQVLANEGFAMQIASLGQDTAKDRSRLLAYVRNDSVSGVLTIGPCLEPYREIFTDIPVVTSCTFCATSTPWVGEDVGVVCRESVAYLLENGHIDIAMVCGPWIDGAGFAAFAKGYQEAFSTAGKRWDRSLMFHSYSGESLDELAQNVLSGRLRPTAVFCENWKVCRAIIRAADQLKIDIPSSLSLVGYGQNILDINEPVPITAYVSESAKIGQAAAKMLADLVGGRSSAQDLVALPGKLLKRDSVCTLHAGKH